MPRGPDHPSSSPPGPRTRAVTSTPAWSCFPLRGVQAGPQMREGAMTDHAYVPRRQPEHAGDVLCRAILVKGHPDDRHVAGRKAVETVLETYAIDGMDVHSELVCADDGFLFHRLPSPPLGAVQVPHRVAARAQDEGCQPIRFPDSPRPGCLDDGEEHLLHEIGSRVLVAEVAQPIEADAHRVSVVNQVLRCPGVIRRARDVPNELPVRTICCRGSLGHGPLYHVRATLVVAGEPRPLHGPAWPVTKPVARP